MSTQDLTTTSLALNIQYHTIQGVFVQTIDARELFQELQNGWQFGNWITNRIKTYGFVQDRDYLFLKNPFKTLGRPEHIYHLTLDMAKSLCMVERTPKGQQARQYFLDCEKALANVHGLVSTMLEPVTTLLQQFGTIVEQMDRRLHALEETQQVVQGSNQLTAKGQLPAPAPHIKEHAEVSRHLAAAWALLRDSGECLTNKEIAQRTGIAPRTARAHTRYLLQIGMLDLHETFPRHLYVLAAQAQNRNSGVYRRLNTLTEIIQARVQY